MIKSELDKDIVKIDNCWWTLQTVLEIIEVYEKLILGEHRLEVAWEMIDNQLSWEIGL